MDRGGAPDPQLHDHCVVANLALRREGSEAADGCWGAVDSRELFRLTQEGDAVYLAELAAELMALGYPIERRGRYFEIAGVSPELIEHFSSRDREVTAAARAFTRQHGRSPTNDELRVLVVSSRQPGSKHTECTAAIDEEWKAALRPEGSDVFRLDAVRQPDPLPLPERGAAITEILEELTSPLSERCLTNRSAVFDTRQLRNVVGQAAHGRVAGEHLDDLVAAVTASPELVRLDDEHWSTREMLETERAVLAGAAERCRRTQPAVNPDIVDLSIWTSRVRLSEEQQDAVRRLCGRERIALLTAPAGAGKGEVLRTVAQAHNLAGRRVVAVAAAGEIAQRLGRDIEADRITTVDAFSLRWMGSGLHEVGPGDLVVVDEAALLETWRWRTVLDAAGDARVIAAGDHGQLLPIEAGGLWPVLVQRVPTIELSENYRAREDWAKDAWEALRHGRAPEALSALDERGQILLAEDRVGARDAAVEVWDARRRDGPGSTLADHLLVTDGSNYDVDELNRMAQLRRIEAGELTGPPVHVITRDVKRGIKREEDLLPGDLVVFERQVYLRDGRGRSLPRVENGERGIVVNAEPENSAVTVRLSLREVEIDSEHLDALRLGYAQHVYTAQGRTVDEVYTVIGGWQTTERSAYVGISRARQASWVISDYCSLDATRGDGAAALVEMGRRCGQAPEEVAAISVLERIHGGPDSSQAAAGLVASMPACHAELAASLQLPDADTYSPTHADYSVGSRTQPNLGRPPLRSGVLSIASQLRQGSSRTSSEARSGRPRLILRLGVSSVLEHATCRAEGRLLRQRPSFVPPRTKNTRDGQRNNDAVSGWRTGHCRWPGSEQLATERPRKMVAPASDKIAAASRRCANHSSVSACR